MNICFYTTTDPSVTNLLNMGHLIHERPHHNYSFVRVRSSIRKSLSLKDRARRVYAELKFRDGRFELQRDQVKFRETLGRHVRPISWDKFQCVDVDAVNDEMSGRFIDSMKPDLIIQSGAGILKENIFSKAATINVHHGLAPDIRGIESTLWCMLYGITDKIGVTCHFIDKYIDTGAVISRQALGQANGSFTDIQTANYLMGREVLLKGVDILERGKYRVSHKGQVSSYYFGLPKALEYYALKKNGFLPILNIAEKSFKMKDLNVAEEL